MPETVPSSVHLISILLIYLFNTPPQVGIVIISILQVRKLRLREEQGFKLVSRGAAGTGTHSKVLKASGGSFWPPRGLSGLPVGL